MSQNLPKNDLFEAAIAAGFLRKNGDEYEIPADSLKSWLEGSKGVPVPSFVEESKSFNAGGRKAGVGTTTVYELVEGIRMPKLPKIRVILQTLEKLGAFSIQNEASPIELAHGKAIKTDFVKAPKHLVGKWFGLHMTVGYKEAPLLARTEIQIFSDGRCELLHHVHSHKYIGGITEFHDGVATIVTRSVDEEPDVIYWKINYNRLGRSEQLSGGWFGIDFIGKIRTGSLLLSDQPTICDDEATRLLNACGSVTAPPLNTNTLDDEFDLKKVWAAIGSAKKGAEIRVITSFIPNWNSFVQELVKLHNNNKPVWKILFMDPDLDQLVNARFKLRSDEPDDSDLNDVTTEKEQLPVKSSIRREANLLLRQRKLKSIDVEVRYSSAWPVGMGFLIEDRVLFLGLMYATKTAADAPVLEVRDQNSNAWRFFQDDFNEIWSKSSRPAWDIIPPVSMETAD